MKKLGIYSTAGVYKNSLDILVYTFYNIITCKIAKKIV